MKRYNTSDSVYNVKCYCVFPDDDSEKTVSILLDGEESALSFEDLSLQEVFVSISYFVFENKIIEYKVYIAKQSIIV
jgi:hypothetical protein